MKLLKIRAFAWFVAAVIMILSVFAGALIDYIVMRNDTLAAFEREMMPLINQAMIHAHDMNSVAQSYLGTGEILEIGIGLFVAEIQATDDPDEIYQHHSQLNRAVWAIYDRLIGDTMEMADTNRSLLIDFHRNFMQMDMLLEQARYNSIAENFNNRLEAGLGFMVRPFIGEMPRFD
jgi:hypothetical protein